MTGNLSVMRLAISDLGTGEHRTVAGILSFSAERDRQSVPSEGDILTEPVTRTFTGSVRLRNAREHRALEHLWWWANTVRNAVCEQELGIRAHNRRVFLSHGTDWEPDKEDFARVLDEAQQGKLVGKPQRNALGKQWTEVTRDEREHLILEGFNATQFGRRVVNGIFEDFCRRYGDERTPPPKFRPGWKLRSVCVYDARLAWRDNRQDAVLRVQGLPAVRIRLHRPVPNGARILGTVRIVRRQRGCQGRVPSRYEIRVMVQSQVNKCYAQGERLRGWDPGGRRSLTSDQGDVVQVLARDSTERRRLARRVARRRKGSRGWRKAKAALRVHQERETRAREQHRHKQVQHACRKADIHVVEHKPARCNASEGAQGQEPDEPFAWR